MAAGVGSSSGSRAGERAGGGRGGVAGEGNKRGGGGGGGFGGASSGTQRHANRRAEIERVAKATGQSSKPTGNSGVSQAGRTSSTLAGMGRDFRNVGNSFTDSLGNRVASLLGFNEQRPNIADAMGRATGTPVGQTIDKRAGWGFDPAGLIGGAVGMGFGVPGLGMAADWVSSQFGRPLEIGMGPSVFGGGPSYGGSISPGAGSVNTASGAGGYGGQAAGGGTGNGQFGYSPFRTHTTGNPSVRKPVASIPQSAQQPAQQQPNLYAKPWPGQSQSYSPFGNGSWAGWG